ncbi:replication protein A 70 kDa DNA-binding subunit C-like protein [Tanacetum coccineum]
MMQTYHPCHFPRFLDDTRLEVDVSDNTAQAVVVMFNETATALVNCSADSLMDTVDESSEDHLNLPPALSNLIGTAHVMEINVGSMSNLDDYPDNQPQKMKRIVQDPSIVTPSKPVEERKKSRMDIEDSKTEDSSNSANAKGKKGAVEPSAKKRKNRYIHSLGCTFTYTKLHVRLFQHADLYSDH